MTSTRITSTTGTAPLELSVNGATVHIHAEDGSGQVYVIAELIAALRVAA
ncbi:hypothetical protein [Cryobacterium roopkundense]|uniref:Transposase n=1 Tax=Cryobacterium roopkundense TaxID=1001240 RepID=A0A7W8ZXG5_9MICO|nr:hypothetical protein [Cryobacterium roopkundense]MBB5641777.1 hypothetical protein [Cryobacterium roopkundense]